MATTSISTVPSSTSSVAASTSAISGGGSSGLTSSASLYLYTFLATLLLLLSISGAIVARSYILRRRRRRMIEEAIANGTYVPPPRSPGSLGAKPRLHDVHLALDVQDVLRGKGLLAGKHGTHAWDSLMPVAATALRLPEAHSDPPPAPAPPSNPARSRRLWNGHRAPQPIPLEPLAPQQDLESAQLYGKEVGVTFLIAMPAPHRKQHEEEPLPHVEFGLAQVVVRQDGAGAGGTV